MKRKVLLLSMLMVCLPFAMKAQTWALQYTNFPGTSVIAEQIEVVDSNIVWIKGYNGSGSGPKIRQFSVTADGGYTWIYKDFNVTPTTVYPANIAAVSALKAYCIAYDTAQGRASFWKTIDGGTTWNKITGVMNTPPTTFADVVKFWDANNGFAIGDPVSGEFDLYITHDGGDTWIDVHKDSIDNALPGPEYGYNGADCGAVADNGVGVFITDSGRVYRTLNYGLSWHITPTPPFDSCRNSARVYVSNADNIIAGHWKSSLTAWEWMITDDGGLTWSSLSNATAMFYQSVMCYIPGSNNYYVSTSVANTGNAGVSHSEDGGLTWTDYVDALLQPSGSNIQCYGVDFYNRNFGWVGVYDLTAGTPVILKYTDNVLMIDPHNPDTAYKLTPYTYNFTATGGVPSYTFSLLSGTLPTGLTLNSAGVLSGTPTVTGTFVFTVQVMDNVSATDHYQYTLYIPYDVGIGQASKKPSVKIYPNPVTDQLNIVCNTTVNRISIISMIGDRIMDRTYSSMNPVVNTSKLLPGMYYLVIENSDGILRENSSSNKKENCKG